VTLESVMIPGEEKPFMESSSATIRFKLWSLLGRRFVIHEVALNDPRVAWRQSEKGRWEFPELEVTDELSPGEVAVEPLPPPPSEEEWPPPDAPPAGEELQRSNPVFAVEVQEFRINDGSFEFLDENGDSFAAFDDIDATVDVRTPDS